MTLGAMQAIVSQRLAEGATPTFYPAAEIYAALNEAQRFWALITLSIERTASWTVGATFTHMLTPFPDWIAPLRLTTAGGAKIRPARLSELWSLDTQWPAASTPGPPARYALLGSDLAAVYPTPASPVNVTAQYAGAPVALVNAGDVPEIQPEYHPALVSYAIYRCRLVEGANELQKVIGLYGEFMTAAGEHATYVRARNVGAGYDTNPPELVGMDASRLTPLKRARR
jgi:hypothetical protein